jgi:hypothetical protein
MTEASNPKILIVEKIRENHKGEVDNHGKSRAIIIS